MECLSEAEALRFKKALTPSAGMLKRLQALGIPAFRGLAEIP
jgi:hypothetical protein